MSQLICTVGLPRSGKSTWAKQQNKDHGIPIVNPDSIRLAMHGQRFALLAEPYVWAVAETMVRSLFLAGHEVVILDATNISRKRRDRWQSKDWSTSFYVLETSQEECLSRAGDDMELKPVIERMAASYEPLGEDEQRLSPLGATGEYPEGQLSEDDEGELRIAIAADSEHNIVRVEFGKPTAWLGLPRDVALTMAQSLQDKANDLKG